MGIGIYGKKQLYTVLLSDKPWYLNIPREVEGVNAHVGIQNMIEVLENDRRKGIPQVEVLISYGFSLDRNATKYYAHLAKNIVISMFCVGVGPTDKKELKDIVSDPNYVLNVDSFEELENKVSELVQLID